MKALSICEPYLSFILDGHKSFETRSKKTKYRGDLLLCTSKKQMEYPEEMKLVLPDYSDGFDYITGGIAVATCRLSDCSLITEDFIQVLKVWDPAEYAAGFYKEGRYAWVLENVRPIVPFFVRGRPWMFEVDDKAIRYI